MQVLTWPASTPVVLTMALIVVPFALVPLARHPEYCVMSAFLLCLRQVSSKQKELFAKL
jgi:hypothetical protein